MRYTTSSRTLLTETHSLVCHSQSLREPVGFQRLLDAALHPRLLRVALLNDAEQQHVVLGASCVPLLESLLAQRTFGRDVPNAPAAQRVAAGQGRRFPHDQLTHRAVQQLHGRVMSLNKRSAGYMSSFINFGSQKSTIIGQW